MRKIVCEDWNLEIKLDDVLIHNVVIENKKYFRRIIEELCKQTEGFEGKFILSDEKNSILDIQKNIHIIIDMLSLNPNSKKISTKIVEKISRFVNEDFQLYTEIRHHLDNFYENIMEKSLFELTRNTDIKLIDILKLADFKLEYENEGFIEKLLIYIRTIREFIGIDIIILVNISYFLDVEEINLFFNTIINEGIYLINIESEDNDFRIESDFKKYIIDEDLCEIYN